MDNYLKENRNQIEYKEIQEHFSVLGDWIWRGFLAISNRWLFPLWEEGFNQGIN